MSAADRILGSFRKLVEGFTARLPAAFVWRYSVVSATETSFSGRALAADCPFADMPSIPLMPGIAGAGVKPAIGSIALVAFVDGDPGRPFVVGWDQTVPVSVTVDASTKLRAGPSAASVELAGGGPAVHRVNDLGTGGTFTVVGAAVGYAGADGTTQWALTATANLVTGTVTFVITPVSGTPGALVTKATTGSGKVTSG